MCSSRTHWKTCEERSNAFGKDLLLQLPSLIPCHIRDRSEWHDRLRSHIYDHLVARSRNSGLQPLVTDRTCVDESMSGHAAPARCLKLLPKFRNLVALQASSSRLRQLSIVATCRLRLKVLVSSNRSPPSSVMHNIYQRETFYFVIKTPDWMPGGSRPENGVVQHSRCAVF